MLGVTGYKPYPSVQAQFLSLANNLEQHNSVIIPAQPTDGLAS